MKKILSLSLVLFSANAMALTTQYSALVFDDFHSPHSASMGALAVGHDAKLSGYSIMYDDIDFPADEYSLIVGGDLSYNSGRVYQGSIIAQGNVHISKTVQLGLAKGSTIDESSELPINFDDLKQDNIDYSLLLSQEENVGAITYQWGGLYLSGDCKSDIQVFNLNGYQLEKAHTLELSCVPDNATVIVNISGNKRNFKPLSNKNLSDFAPHRQKTIFNLYEATSLSISGVALEGLILAPKADIHAPSGASYVGIIANSWKGSMSLDYQPFNGKILGKEPPPINAKLKWHWQGGDFMPEYHQVMMTPVTGQLNDDNGDGNIDNNDIADVVFVSFKGNQHSQPGVLRALSGKDGTELWSYENGPVLADPRYSPAIADMDKDGVVDIIVGNKSNRTVYVVNNKGAIKDSIKYAGFRNIAIADINADENPEILLADGIYSYQNSYLYKFKTWGPDPIALDYNLDGDLEVFANATLYNQYGDVLWSDTKHDYFWFSAVANLDDDIEPEFITSIPGRNADYHQLLAVYEHDGTLKWQAGDLSKQGGGVQAISHFLDNEQLGIVSASIDNVNMYDVHGNIVWSYPIDDSSSYKIGVSAYDFDGDGRDEVIIQDHFKVAVLDGKSGKERLAIVNSSSTLYEYPIVVDLEGDNNAELIIVSNNYEPKYGVNSGVRAFESKGSEWKNATRIWNQHSYHQTNISQDGQVPLVEMPSWLFNNTYRSSTLK